MSAMRYPTRFVIEPIFIRNLPKKYRKYREFAGKISDKKVAMGRIAPMAMNRADKKISDKNIQNSGGTVNYSEQV